MTFASRARTRREVHALAAEPPTLAPTAVPGVEHSEVHFGTTRIAYEVRRGKREKTVAIAVEPDGAVVLRAPPGTPIDALDSIVQRKAAWIVERLKKTSDLPPPLTDRQFVSGETFLYLGRQYRLKVKPGPPAVRLEHGHLVAHAPHQSAVRDALVTWYRAHAAERLPEIVAEWAPVVGVDVPNVLIREPRKRWGSCDERGVLRFNWRIIQAPRRLVEYVVVHELVHLVHREHSREYWARLGQAMPDYERRRQGLRAVGHRMVW